MGVIQPAHTVKKLEKEQPGFFRFPDHRGVRSPVKGKGGVQGNFISVGKTPASISGE